MTQSDPRPGYPGNYYRDLRARADIGVIARALLGDRIASDSEREILVDCPRHESQSGRSLSINVHDGLWHCFGCDVGGDVIQLVEFVRSGEVSKCKKGQTTKSHRDARDWLAEKIGMPLLARLALSAEDIAKLEAEEEERGAVYAALAAVAESYHERLLASPEAMAWIREQYGFDESVIKRFKIGFADDGPATVSAMALKGLDTDVLLATGAFRRDSYGRVWPFFEKRITFPYELAGHVVYMIGRRTPWTEDSEFEQGKYKKLPVYEAKKHPDVSKAIDNTVLYGESVLAARPETVLICEGITDTIAAQVAGLAAISPATVTIKDTDIPRIAAALARAKRVVLVLDNELSGVGGESAIRMAKALDRNGAECVIATLPLREKQTKARADLKGLLGDEVFARFESAKTSERKQVISEALANRPGDLDRAATLVTDSKIDVCEWFRLGGTPEEFQVILDQGRDVLDVEISRIPSDDDPRGRASAITGILDYVRNLPPVLQEQALKQIKQATGITLETLHEQIAQLDQAEERAALVERRSSGAPGEPGGGPYREGIHGLDMMVSDEKGDRVRPLTNFKARIICCIHHDDGVQQTSTYEIRCQVGAESKMVRVAAAEFAPLAWVAEHLGPEAIVFAGSTTKDNARAAIQFLSKGGVQYTRVFTHTGWRRLDDGTYAYLHGAGAIGPNGPVADMKVELPQPLAGMVLPTPPDRTQLPAVVEALSGLLVLGPAQIMFPLVSAALRAVFGDTDFTMFLFGVTGAFKTEVATLLQSFYGTGFNARTLPSNFISTANATETLAFTAKDMVFVVDDFVTGGSRQDIQRQHRDGERLLRGQGNRSGRSRLSADATLRAGRAPRGMALVTGEELPARQSARARSLVIELEEGAVTSAKLTRCQAHAGQGLYALFTVGFICWIAPQYEALKQRLRDRALAVRDLLQRDDRHRRTAAIVGELQSGFELALAYLQEIGAISGEKAAELVKTCTAALASAAEAQGQHQLAAEPASLFMRLLRSAISSGQGHFASRHEPQPPPNAESAGWRVDPMQAGGPLKPLGDRLGWVDGDSLYLEPDAAFKAAQGMASESEGIPISVITLGKRLREHGYLASTEQDRGHMTVRVTIGGKRLSLLHLRLDVFNGLAQPSQSAQTPAGDSQDEESESPRQPLGGPSPAHADQPGEPTAAPPAPAGPIGPIGPADNTALHERGERVIDRGTDNPDDAPSSDRYVIDPDGQGEMFPKPPEWED
jgi:DNA primase